MTWYKPLSAAISLLAALALSLFTPPLLAGDGRIQPALKVSYALSTLHEESVLQGHEEGDLWERIRSGFALDEPNPGLSRTHEKWFSSRPAHLERAIERSRPYLFHIVEEVERRGMPMEIALLPLIESAFNPRAVSPQKAAGIWQFMPSTGKVFGLKQNEWFDGRRDIVQATRAALDYLEYLHGMFNDWELALAAYNCGEGCVQRAIRNSGQRTYAKLRLPTETRHYVPKLVAVRNIVREPERFGVNLHAIADQLYFMQVRLDQPMESRQAARLAEISLDEFLTLNPAFQRRVIHTDTRGVLLLPAEQVETFHHNMHSRGDKKKLATYQASQGESIYVIARDFGVTLEWLKEHNPLKLHKGRMARAQSLVVPTTAKRVPVRKVAEKKVDVRKTARTHVVQPGDTLSHLARRYNVRLTELRRSNDGVDTLIPGRTLDIPEQAG
jgi:membrane-bound lytic murein transglycosylase D